MPKKDEMMWVKLSGWLFILGIAVSVVVGLFPNIMDSATTTGILAVLGFIIGLLGIAGMGTLEKCDIEVFLLAVVALMAAGGAGRAFENVLYVGTYLMGIVNNIGILVVPAAVLIALKAIWKSAQNKF
jgi:hypothetical protein